jgi:hypothetical protein
MRFIREDSIEPVSFEGWQFKFEICDRSKEQHAWSRRGPERLADSRQAAQGRVPTGQYGIFEPDTTKDGTSARWPCMWVVASLHSVERDGFA